MTIGQMRLHLREGDRLEGQRRASFIGDVCAAIGGALSENSDAMQSRIDDLRGV